MHNSKDILERLLKYPVGDIAVKMDDEFAELIQNIISLLIEIEESKGNEARRITKIDQIGYFVPLKRTDGKVIKKRSLAITELGKYEDTGYTPSQILCRNGVLKIRTNLEELTIKEAIDRINRTYPHKFFV